MLSKNYMAFDFFSLLAQLSSVYIFIKHHLEISSSLLEHNVKPKRAREALGNV